MSNIAGKIGNMMIGWDGHGVLRVLIGVGVIQDIKKHKNSKSQNFDIHPLSRGGQYRGTRSSDLYYTAQISIKGVCYIFSISSKWRKRKTCFFFKKKGTFEAAPLRQKRKSDVYAVTGPGRGTGEGEASPSPPRRENFEISPPSNGISLHLTLNSIAFCHHTIH